MRVALRIDVLNRPGAQRGVPAVLRLLEQYGLRASFFVCLGPGRLPVPALDGARRRLSATGRGLLGALRRAPLIGRECASELREIAAAGQDLGLSAFDAHTWWRNAAEPPEGWIETEMQRSVDAFGELFGERPRAFAAPGWQVHPALFDAERRLDLHYASDTRGRHPYRPLLQGVRSSCPQIPVTLPTLPEIVASGSAPLAGAHEYLYAESRHLRPAGHVYAARADLEGIAHLDLLEKLLVMWKGQDGALRPLAEVREELDLERLPVHQVGWGRTAGNDDYLAQQSVQVPQ